MSNNIRIKTTPGGGDKAINISINQKFDFIEILSLKISQTEAYRRFCSDYGVVVGRVIVNNGVGVPNAKVSIFIPVDEVDLEDPEISGLYPYELTSDVDSEGIPYNLVPRNNRGKDECFTPIGTFPSKREIQDNPEMGEIYCQYYKFTTTTNNSGDYMFFGVPVGSHMMHIDGDISDIGFLSQRPYDQIREGEDSKKFTSSTKFKNRQQDSSVKQLKTSTPMSVYVPPFWGDTEQCNIGIARSDVNLSTTIRPQAIFMGSLLSDNDKHALSRTCIPRKKLGKMEEVVTGNGRIEMIRKTFDGNTERFDVEGGEVIDDDGVWAYQIPMNTGFMVTSENGSFVPSDDPTKGIPTKTKVRFRVGMEVNGDEGKLRTRAKYLVPHNPDTWIHSTTNNGVDFSFDTSTRADSFAELSWNKIYTIKNHVTRVQARGGADNRNFIGIKNVDDAGQKNPFPFNKLDNDINPLFYILCIIISIVARIVGLINKYILPLINVFIYILNVILGRICKILANIGKYKLICGSTSCRKKFCIGTCRGKCKGGSENSPPGSGGDQCYCGDIISYMKYITLKCSAGNPPTKEHAPNGLYGNSNKVNSKGNPKNARHLTWLATGTVEDADGNKTYGVEFHYLTRDKDEPNQPNNPEEDQYRCGPLDYPPFHQKATIQGCDAGWTKCMSFVLADALDVFKFDFYNDWINGNLYSFLLKYKIKKKGAGREKFCEVDCDDWPGEGVDNDNKRGSDNKCKNNFILDTCTAAAPFFSGAWGLGLAPTTSNTIFDNGVNSYKRIKTRSGYIKKFDGELYYSPMTRIGDNKLFATDIVNLGSMFDCDWEGLPLLYKYLTDTTFNIPPFMPEYETLPSSTTTGGNVTTDGVGILVTTGFDTKLDTTSTSILRPPSRLIGRLSCLGLDTDSNSCNNLKRLSELGIGLDEFRLRQPTSLSSALVPEVVDNKITNQDVEQDYVRGIFRFLNDTSVTSIESVKFDSGGSTATGYPDYQDSNYGTFRAGVGGINLGNTKFSNKGINVYDNSFYFYFGLNKGATALTKMKRKYFTECAPEEDIDFFVITTSITPDTVASGPNGAIAIEPSGGVGPYSYSWTGPTVVGASYPVTNNTKDVENLYAGTYNVKVVDANGNIASGVFIVPGPPSIACSVQVTNVAINGNSTGEIIIDITTLTTSPYTIEVFDYTVASGVGTVGTTNHAAGLSPTTLTSLTIPGLKSGSYKITVKDSGTPESTFQQIVFISEPSALDVTVTGTDIKCNGGNDGLIITTVTGGNPPYVYEWTSGSTTTTVATTTSLSNLKVGSYKLKVKDGNGTGTFKEITRSIVLSEPSLLSNITLSSPNTCTPGSTGTINVTGIGGGTPPYTVNLISSVGPDPTPIDGVVLNSAQFNSLDNGASAGSLINTDAPEEGYEVTVVDANGCSINEYVDVFVPNTPLTVSGFDDSAGGISASISGGVYSTDPENAWGVQKYKVRFYINGNWSSLTTENAGIVNAGTIASSGTPWVIEVTDRDGNGCTATAAGSTVIYPPTP